MLQTRNLTITMKKDLRDLLRDFTFSLNPGDKAAIIGEEGNGKSTLLRALAGDPSVESYIEVSGSFSCRDSAAYLPQELLESERALSAYDFFCMSPVFFDQSPRELGELAARLSLPADVFYSDQLMQTFSGGERVKLQLARLLMSRPTTSTAIPSCGWKTFCFPAS